MDLIKSICHKDSANKQNGEYEEEEVIRLSLYDSLIGYLLSTDYMPVIDPRNTKTRRGRRRRRRKRRKRKKSRKKGGGGGGMIFVCVALTQLIIHSLKHFYHSPVKHLDVLPISPMQAGTPSI